LLLTPPSTLRALSARYRPLLHPSAIKSQGGLEPTRPPPSLLQRRRKVQPAPFPSSRS